MINNDLTVTTQRFGTPNLLGMKYGKIAQIVFNNEINLSSVATNIATLPSNMTPYTSDQDCGAVFNGHRECIGCFKIIYQDSQWYIRVILNDSKYSSYSGYIIGTATYICE